MDYKENTQEKLVELYHMLGDKKELRTLFYSRDYAIPYKELIIYPVSLDFYEIFYMFSECLTLPKHKIASLEVIQMRYLDYIFYNNEALEIDNTKYEVYLRELLLMCLNMKRMAKVEVVEDGEEYITEVNTINFIYNGNSSHWEIQIQNRIYTWEDFDEIREIICEQNCVELPDIQTHPDLLRKYEEYKAYMEKINKDKIGSFEDMLLALTTRTPYKKNDLLKLTIRTFIKLLERVNYVVNCDYQKMLAPYMDSNAQKNIKSWLSEIPKINKVDEMSTDLDEMTQKINNA